ncbi:ATP-grasp fold amidoligase family protein [Arthrobacter sp. MDT1-48-3]
MSSPSLYLRLMRERFSMLNDHNVDPVPWELDDKDTAYAYVKAAGYRVPRYEKVSSAAEALAAGKRFGPRFVVKQPNRHSTKGIYVLESIGEGRYLELLSLRTMSVDDLKTDGPEPDYWLAEECIDSGIEGKPIPFDYKIYAFNGRVTHVNQIDRNVSPPRMAMFDGAFIPLELNKDFTIDENRWLPENHVIPKFAGAMLEMAASLSAGLDTRFVKVDCYDGPEGPIFGEFTFASGGDDTGMIRYSSEILEKLDRAMDGQEIGALSGFDIDMRSFRQSLGVGPTVTCDPYMYSRMSCGAIQGDRRYAPLLASNLADGTSRHVFALGAHLAGYLNGDRSRAFAIQHLVRASVPPLNGSARLREFEVKALSFHDERSDGNPWHTSRAAEVRIASGDSGALAVLRDVAASGYKHAQRVLDQYERAHLKQ